MRAPLLALAILAAAAPAAGAGLSARAEAGLNGVARAGRWMPVTIVLENDGPAVEGTLTAIAGDARASRPVTLGSPSRKRFELYLRAPDVDAGVVVVEVRTAPGTSALISTRAPFRIASADAPFTLCVTAGVSPADSQCTTRLDAGAMPASWRGLDAVDAVAWPSAEAIAALDETQRTAYERAAAVRRWNASTVMAPRWPALPAAASRGASPALSIYITTLFLLTLMLARIARRPAFAYGAAGVVVVAGTAAVFADGRLTASPLTLDEVAIVRADARLDGAQVQVRARATSPSAGTATFRTLLADDEMSAGRGGELVASADSSGAAVLGGWVARQQRLEIDYSGFTTSPPVAVEHDEGAVTIRNLLSTALTECSADGFRLAAPRIEIGGSLRLDAPGTIADAALVCTIERPAAYLAWNRGPIAHHGRAVLAVDLRRPEPTP